MEHLSSQETTSTKVFYTIRNLFETGQTALLVRYKDKDFLSQDWPMKILNIRTSIGPTSHHIVLHISSGQVISAEHLYLVNIL